MAENIDFTPITLPGISQASLDVELKLGGIPTLSELTARLGALPRPALEPPYGQNPISTPA